MPQTSRIKRAAKILLRGEHSPVTNWFQNAGYEVDSRGLLVCPLPVFETTSKDMFLVALLQGLRPDSYVLEVGAGCLRTGFQFIQHLEPGHYFGIEPHGRLLEAGRELILRGLDAEKKPTFDANEDFDFGVFGRKFDFVVAMSIWSHTDKRQNETMLDSFKANANPGGKFIASFLPPTPERPDYKGEGWIGRDRKQQRTGGLVAHDPAWVAEAAAKRGLTVEFFDRFTTLNQHWLIFTRP